MQLKQISLETISLYGVPITLFLLLTFGFDFNGLYGQDSHEYLRCSKEIKHFFLEGTPIGEFHWPKGYSFFGAVLSLIGIKSLLAIRLVSLISALGTLYFSRKLIQLLFDVDGALFLILGAATQVYFIRGGMLVMSDMLCALFIVAMFYHYARLTQQNAVLSLVWLLSFALLAFFTRYASIPILIAPIAHGVFVILRKHKIFIQFVLITLGIAVAVMLMMVNSNLLKMGMSIFDEWKFVSIFSRSFTSLDQHQMTYTVPNFMYVFANFFHIGFLSLGVFLIPFYKKIGKPNVMIMTVLVLYLLFLSGLITQNYRFFILTHPLVLIMLFPAFKGLWEWLKKKKLLHFFVIGTLLFNSAFFIYSFSKTYKVHEVEKNVAEAIKKLQFSGPIYSFYVDQSFLSYGIKNEVRNLYMEKYESFEQGSIVVFNETKFNEGWKESNVIKNWESLNESHGLEILEELSNNWNIYRIK